MKTLSLKLKDDIFTEAEKMVYKIHVSRNAYINHAVEFYNKLNKRRMLRKVLQEESKALRADSLDVLKEMEALEDDIRE